ncbi:MAG: LysR substrate-binding domain-containing protein, partial [Pseudomonadota bacterium]
ASATVSDLARREADIAIRNVAPAGDDLMARRLKDGVAHLYAARAYADTCGDLDQPSELACARFIGFGDDREFIDALSTRGVTIAPENFATGSRSHLVHWAMVREGLGIGIMPAVVADADPVVARVGCGLEPFTFPIWLVAHRELRTSRRVRLVFDHLATELNAL